MGLLVIFEIGDARIRKLAEETLRRAFKHEVNTIAAMYGESIPGETLDRVFNFYSVYIRRVKLEDTLTIEGLGCAPTEVGGNVEEKGEVHLFLPRSMSDQLSDDEIVGVIAHELGHHHNQFHYGESVDVHIGDKSELDAERDADETAAMDLGFEREIRAIRAKVPLP